MGRIPITLFGGIITNEQITTVLVKQKIIEKEATIVETNISVGIKTKDIQFFSEGLEINTLDHF